MAFVKAASIVAMQKSNYIAIQVTYSWVYYFTIKRIVLPKIFLWTPFMSVVFDLAARLFMPETKQVLCNVTFPSIDIVAMEEYQQDCMKYGEMQRVC